MTAAPGSTTTTTAMRRTSTQMGSVHMTMTTRPITPPGVPAPPPAAPIPTAVRTPPASIRPTQSRPLPKRTAGKQRKSPRPPRRPRAPLTGGRFSRARLPSPHWSYSINWPLSSKSGTPTNSSTAVSPHASSPMCQRTSILMRMTCRTPAARSITQISPTSSPSTALRTGARITGKAATRRRQRQSISQRFRPSSSRAGVATRLPAPHGTGTILRF